MAITDLAFDPINSSLPFADLNTEVKPPAPLEKTHADPEQPPESDQDQPKQSQFSDTGSQLEELIGPGVSPDSELSISIDKSSKQIVVRVLDKETKEVIREIPPERLARIAESLRELSLGLVDERA